jgi:hypothetical protein
MGIIAPRKFAGHGMPCPYEITAAIENRFVARATLLHRRWFFLRGNKKRKFGYFIH